MPGRNYQSSTPYRYGMNGQENDDEITGNHGTHTSAEYWEYDTRLGRRWNIDPVINPSVSPYACFDNNPIFFADPNGDTPGGGDKDKAEPAKRDATSTPAPSVAEMPDPHKGCVDVCVNGMDTKVNRDLVSYQPSAKEVDQFFSQNKTNDYYEWLAQTKYPSSSGSEAIVSAEGPVQLPFDNAVVNSEYKMRVHPVTGKLKLHGGIDMVQSNKPVNGQDIRATTSGVVTEQGYNKYNGNYVFIQDSKGYKHGYLHMQNNSVKVAKLQKVTAGTIIGKVGTTGQSKGPHLHYLIKAPDGTVINPRSYNEKFKNIPSTDSYSKSHDVTQRVLN